MTDVRSLLLGATLVAALAAGACATTRAKAQTETAPLEVPMPPPRVIVPPEPEPAAPPATAPEPEPRQQKPPRRPAPARPEAKPEPKVEKKPEAAAEPLVPVVPPVTGALQQQVPSAPEAERRVRDQLAQASRDLNRVDYRGLNADARVQYDTARRFIKEAEQALAEKNLVFAAKVAEKAAGLAAVLVGR